LGIIATTTVMTEAMTFDSEEAADDYIKEYSSRVMKYG